MVVSNLYWKSSPIPIWTSGWAIPTYVPQMSFREKSSSSSKHCLFSQTKLAQHLQESAAPVTRLPIGNVKQEFPQVTESLWV